MDWSVLLSAASEAVSQVLVVVLCGIILSRADYLTNSAQKIASSISWTQFIAFWPIPVYFLLFSAISWLIAKCGSRFLRFSKDEEKFVTASVLFSNTNSLPMALVQSLALSAAGTSLLRDEFDTQEKSAARGISYILFYAIFGNLVRWSYGFALLVPKDQEPSSTPNVESRARIDNVPSLHSVLVHVDEPSGSTSTNTVNDPIPSSSITLTGDHHHSYTDYMGDDDNDTDDEDPRTRRNSVSSMFNPPKKIKNLRSTNLQPISSPLLQNSPGRVSLSFKSRHVGTRGATRRLLKQKAKTVFERIRQVLTPPLLTALLALVIGLVPALHQFVMGPNSKFYNYIIRPIEGCGTAAIPMILLCLGAQCVHLASANATPVDPNRPDLHRRRSVSVPSVFANVDDSCGSDASEDDEPEDADWMQIPYSRGQRTQQSYGRTRTALSYASSSVTLSQPQADQSSEDETPEDVTESLPSAENGQTESGLHLMRHRFKLVSPVTYTLVARMLIAPAICLPAILYLPPDLSPILTRDPTFTLTIMLLAAAPTAINMTQLCQIKGFFETEMAQVLFWSYCVLGIPCVLGWSLVGLWAAGRV
ncbi:hypothetical protein FBU30_004227 [Linnemannia zychae]|nr:hypothetical protein FBU30_004227 [Linnemannia zychae]